MGVVGGLVSFTKALFRLPAGDPVLRPVRELTGKQRASKSSRLLQTRELKGGMNNNKWCDPATGPWSGGTIALPRLVAEVSGLGSGSGVRQPNTTKDGESKGIQRGQGDVDSGRGFVGDNSGR